MQLRQGGGSEHRVHRDLPRREYPGVAGRDVRRRDEEANLRRTAEAAEIDRALEKLADRGEVQRIELKGENNRVIRSKPTYRKGISVFSPKASARRAAAAAGCSEPLRSPPATSPRACSARRGTSVAQAGRESDRIQRPGAGAAHAVEAQTPVLEKPIEHAPGKRAVRAAALQREVDPLASCASLASDEINPQLEPLPIRAKTTIHDYRSADAFAARKLPPAITASTAGFRGLCCSRGARVQGTPY